MTTRLLLSVFGDVLFVMIIAVVANRYEMHLLGSLEGEN